MSRSADDETGMMDELPLLSSSIDLVWLCLIIENTRSERELGTDCVTPVGRDPLLLRNITGPQMMSSAPFASALQISQASIPRENRSISMYRHHDINSNTRT